MRLKGKSIPKNIILISLNEEKGYVYNSEEYLHDIEQVYFYKDIEKYTPTTEQKSS